MSIQKRNLSEPDEVRTSEKGKIEMVNIGGITLGRSTLQPGWKWSKSVKPLVDNEGCQGSHLQYHISGRLHVLMDDGTEEEFGPGDVSLIPPGHDAWVVGEDPVVVIELSGMVHYH